MTQLFPIKLTRFACMARGCAGCPSCTGEQRVDGGTTEAKLLERIEALDQRVRDLERGTVVESYHGEAIGKLIGDTTLE